MTKHEALLEARRLWGGSGYVATKKKECFVGASTRHTQKQFPKVPIATVEEWYGNGPTWEEAFAKAVRNGFTPEGAV